MLQIGRCNIRGDTGKIAVRIQYNIFQTAMNNKHSVSSQHIAPEKNSKMYLLVLVTHITNGGKASTMLHKGASDGSNSQYCNGPDITYCSIIHRPKKSQSELGGIRGIYDSHYKWGQG